MNIFAKPNFNFIKWRWHAIVLSLVVVLLGLATVIARGGLPLGVDFTGGTVIVLRFVNPTAEEVVRNALGSLSDEAVVQRSGEAGKNEIMVRLPLVQGAEQGMDLESQALRVEQSLRAANVGEFIPISKDIVGPTIGKDLSRKGAYTTLAALAGILVYIGFRFRFTFAVGAVVATFHDILVTLAFLVWFGYDISLNIIAAILTIAGYSVNDTIVVFDRVRENQRTQRREPLESIVNTAVNQTLGRTVITAGTTFLAVVALYLFGGEVLRGFAFTMLVGIITGTYSTVFIAAAIAIILSRRGSSQGRGLSSPPATAAPVETPRRRARA
jgi:preprotein translocase subunit SecF